MRKSFVHHAEGMQLVWLGATRYYIGRMSSATATFCTVLATSWDKLPVGTRKLLRREVEATFDLDDELRAARSQGLSTGPLPLGTDCDRAQWERVRHLWGMNETPSGAREVVDEQPQKTRADHRRPARSVGA